MDSTEQNYVLQDVPRWKEIRGMSDSDFDAALYFIMRHPEFRSLYKYRVNGLRKKDLLDRALSFFKKNDLPLQSNLYLSTWDIGPGIYIQHGFSTKIFAERIGRNFWVNQNCTIGAEGGRPSIGDNVQVRTNAVVFGGVTIGNNVRIGAGAVVNTDIPDNCTVVPQPARIIYR